MKYVLNNCGSVKGNAKKWAGYRHIALMEGEYQSIIRNTRKASILREATVYVGTTNRSYGYQLLMEYFKEAAEEVSE